MKKTFLIPVTAIAALLAGFYWLSDHDDRPELDYGQTILQHRSEIDYFMRNSDTSPFAGRVSEMHRLNYYPANEQFRVEAKFTPATVLSTMELAASDGSIKNYVLYGSLSFSLQDTPQRLSVYQPMSGNDNSLFLGFTDQTTSEGTYGAGRYLNVEIEGDMVTLDFNLAYNPYCAYNEEFICPFPPRENHLTVPVEAGEKDYKITSDTD